MNQPIFSRSPRVARDAITLWGCGEVLGGRHSFCGAPAVQNELCPFDLALSLVIQAHFSRGGEVPDLSHTYPRDENAAILDWFLG